MLIGVQGEVLHSSYGNQSNFRYAFFMVIAMIAFAIEDAIIKQLAFKLPISQVLIAVGLSGLLVLCGLSILKKELIVHRRFIDVKFLLRMSCELISSIFFVVTMVHVSLTVSSALLQIVPILMTIGGFILFKETVNLRQWVLIFVGLCGSLLVIQPGTDMFNPLSLFALAGAVFLALRDLLTFSMSDNYPPVAIAFWGFASLALGGIVSVPFFGPFCELTAVDMSFLAASSFFGPAAYLALIYATRGGEIGVVAPFRYFRLPIAVLIGILVFDESPNNFTLGGCALIVVSGFFILVISNKQKNKSTSYD